MTLLLIANGTVYISIVVLMMWFMASHEPEGHPSAMAIMLTVIVSIVAGFANLVVFVLLHP